MTQTAGPFGTSSSSVKFLPSAGITPSVGKKLALTRWPVSCSGSPSPVSVNVSNAEMPIDENEPACARISS